MVIKQINSLYQQAGNYLSELDTDWALLIERVGPCQLELQATREPYEALIRAIAFQQLHGRAAEAILKRFLALYPHRSFPLPEEILATENEVLRQCGFSARKLETIKRLAQASLEGQVPVLEQAKQLSNDELIKELTLLQGIGPWTVEMFLIFTLGRMDILPTHDFGVREGYKKMKALAQQPTPKALAQIGEPWSPYRSIAAWYLWRA
jgi:DNA-3-methyladenine glycosylase II